jgi:hypothetical protein
VAFRDSGLEKRMSDSRLAVVQCAKFWDSPTINQRNPAQ